MMETVSNVFETLAAQPVGYWWVLAALVLILLVRRWIGSGRLVALSNPTGRVLVSRGAIKGLIVRTAHNIEGVSHPQTRIYTRGGKLRLRVYIQLRGSNRLSEITTLLQEKLEQALRQNLGLEKIGKIDVVVTDIHPSAKKKASKEEIVSDAAAGAYPWGASSAYAEEEEETSAK